MAGSMAIVEEYAQMVGMVLTTGANFNVDRSCFPQFQQALQIAGIVEFRIVSGQYGTLIISVNEPIHIINKIEEIFESILFGKPIEYEGGI